MGRAPRRYRRLLVIVGICVLTLTACSDGGDADPAEGEATSSPTSEPSPADTPAEATITVADSALGDILVDAEGMTLYVFFADTDGQSTCTGDCEAAWPPLVVEGEPIAGEGLDAGLLGTTERDDGSMQVTVDGQPLYTFGGDEAAGDATGQGMGDVWYVVGPDGVAIEKAAGATGGGGDRDY